MYKSLSLANSHFKNSNIIESLAIYKTLLADTTTSITIHIPTYSLQTNTNIHNTSTIQSNTPRSTSNPFLSLIFSNLIDNFFTTTNTNRYMLVNVLFKKYGKYIQEIKPESFDFICRILLCTDIDSRVYCYEIMYYTQKLITSNNIILKNTLLDLFYNKG